MTGRVLNGNLIVTIDKRFNGSAKESGTRMAALISRIDGSECLFRKGYTSLSTSTSALPVSLNVYQIPKRYDDVYRGRVFLASS